MRRLRDAEPDQSGLRLRATAGRALVADLATGARRRTGERRDRRRVIVRLDLHQDVDRLVGRGVGPAAGRHEPAPPVPALDHRGIVAVGGQHAARIARVRVADHAEQRLLAALAVDDPVGVEDLVTAVLGVRLREHHQFDVRRVAPGARGTRRRGSRSRRRTAPGRGPCSQPRAPAGHRPATVPWRAASARCAGTARPPLHVSCSTLSVIRSCSTAAIDDHSASVKSRALDQVIGDASFEPPHGLEAADVRDVGGFARPG